MIILICKQNHKGKAIMKKNLLCLTLLLLLFSFIFSIPQISYADESDIANWVVIDGVQGVTDWSKIETITYKSGVEVTTTYYWDGREETSFDEKSTAALANSANLSSDTTDSMASTSDISATDTTSTETDASTPESTSTTSVEFKSSSNSVDNNSNDTKKSPSDVSKTKDTAETEESWEIINTVEPTCVEDGYYEYQNTVTGETMQESIPATNIHNYELTESTEATCTEDGISKFVCTVCGDSYDKIIEAIGHDEGEWNVTESASLFKSGIKELKCTICGEILNTESIPQTSPIPLAVVIIFPILIIIIGIILFYVVEKKKKQ